MPADVIPMNPSRGSAEAIIREIAAESGRVFLTDHARERMKERKITWVQVVDCLLLGSVTEGPLRDPRGDWKCTMSRFAAGQRISVVVAFNSKDRVVVVTTF